MLIDIDKVIVKNRIRKDFGNIEELAEDIKTNGLINPPTINKDYKLLAGERRLRACKYLGWTQIEVHMLDTKDEAHDLNVEMSENNMRQNFTGSELAEGIRRQMAIESEKARERQGERTDIQEKFPRSQGGQARDKAGAVFGISGKQAERVLFVDDNRDLLDPAEFAEWDEGKLSTNKAFQKIKAAQKEAEAAKKKAEREKQMVEMELESTKQDLAEAWQAQEDAETEAVMLKRKLESIEHPKPEVIEREVVPDDYDETKRKVEGLRRENERLNREYHEMWQSKLDADKKLEQANELLGERERNSDANRDVEQLINNIYTFLNRHGGKSRAFDQFYRVDGTTQEECRKALVALGGFVQSLLPMTEERMMIGAAE